MQKIQDGDIEQLCQATDKHDIIAHLVAGDKQHLYILCIILRLGISKTSARCIITTSES